MTAPMPGIVINSCVAWLSRAATSSWRSSSAARLRMSRYAWSRGKMIRARSSFPARSSLTLPSNARLVPLETRRPNVVTRPRIWLLSWVERLRI